MSSRRQNNITDHAELYRDIPVYLVGGWYDSWAGNTTANFETLLETIAKPGLSDHGAVDAWGTRIERGHGQLDFGTDAAIADPLAWRASGTTIGCRSAKTRSAARHRSPRTCRIFVMGTGDGRKTADGRVNHGGVGATRRNGRWRHAVYELLPARRRWTTPERSTAGQSSTSFEFDPRHPVPTIGGNISSGDGILLAGAWDQRGGKHVWNVPEPIPIRRGTTWSCSKRRRSTRISR